MSEYQEFLKVYVERARQSGMVRRYLISNRRNWLVVKTSDKESERLVYLLEPRSQLLDHTMTIAATPSKIKADWMKVNEINRIQPKKNYHKIYSL